MGLWLNGMASRRSEKGRGEPISTQQELAASLQACTPHTHAVPSYIQSEAPEKAEM